MATLVKVRGGHTLVDECDVVLVLAYPWLIDHHGYVVRRFSVGGRNNRRQRQIALHREINATPAELVTDHIDGDKLNNTRANLRSVDRKKNSQNRKMHAGNISGFKGVTYHKPSGRYAARITVGYKQKHLGMFGTAEEAAECYAKAAPLYHGDAVRKNALITHQRSEQ
jgi:hypothetical protein